MVFQPEVVKESQDDGKVAVQLVSRWSDSHGLPHSHTVKNWVFNYTLHGVFE